MFQVLLVDDEPLVHQHVGSLPGWIGNGFELCGEVYDAETALRMIERTRPHVAIIDVNMPGMNGVELQRAIGERFPSVKTIMLSSYDDYDYVRECLKNGAADYLLKHRLDGGTLMAALRKAVEDLELRERPAESRGGDLEMAASAGTRLIREHIADCVRGNRAQPGSWKPMPGKAACLRARCAIRRRRCKSSPSGC